MPKKRKTTDISVELASATVTATAEPIEPTKRKQARTSKQVASEMINPPPPSPIPTAALPPTVANGKTSQRVPQSKKVPKAEATATTDNAAPETNLA
jgi:hypothetical protein